MDKGASPDDDRAVVNDAGQAVVAVPASIPCALTQADRDFMEGYHDGRDLDCPEPSANRSNAYRHSFAVGRAEGAGTPILGSLSRHKAQIAEAKDCAA